MAFISISCPSCSATEGVVRNGKSTAGHQRYLCSNCCKAWRLKFTYTASHPGTLQKFIDIVMNVSHAARLHGIQPSILFKWKKQNQEGYLTAIAPGEEVVPAS